MSDTRLDHAGADPRTTAARAPFCWRCVFAALPMLMLTLLFGWFAGGALERDRQASAQSVGSYQEEAGDLFAQNAALLDELALAQQELATAKAAMAAAGDGGVEALIERIAALPAPERAALLSRAGEDLSPTPRSAPEVLALLHALEPAPRGEIFAALPDLPDFTDWFGALEGADKRAWLGRLLGDAAVEAIDIDGEPAPAMRALREERQAAIDAAERAKISLAAAERQLETARATKKTVLAELEKAERANAENARLAQDPEALLQRIAALPETDRPAIYAALTQRLPADPGYAAWLERHRGVALAAFASVIEPADAAPAVQQAEAPVEDAATAEPTAAQAEAELRTLKARLAASEAELASLKTRSAALRQDAEKALSARQSAEAALTAREEALAEERARYAALERRRGALASELSAAKETARAALAEAEAGRGAALAAMKREQGDLAKQLDQATARAETAEASAEDAKKAAEAAKAAERAAQAAAEEKAGITAKALAAQKDRAERAESRVAALEAALAKNASAQAAAPAAPPPALSLPELGVISLEAAPAGVAGLLKDRDEEIALLRRNATDLKRDVAALRKEKDALDKRLAAASLTQRPAAQVAERRPTRPTGGDTSVIAAAGPEWRRIALRDIVDGAPDNISASVLFASASADLTRKGRHAVRRLGVALVKAHKADPDADWRLVVEGHTDPLPMRGRDYPSNWALSAARAAAVTQYLHYLGVPQERLMAVGLGASQPKDARWTREAFAANRRIELKMLAPNGAS